MPSLSGGSASRYVRILNVGDSGCLSGDTEIVVTRGRSRGKVKNLRTLHKMFNGGKDWGRQWDLSIPTETLTWDGESVRYHKVASVTSSGVKPVVKVATFDGEYIEATEDHRVLTPEGWKRISERPTHIYVRKKTFGGMQTSRVEGRITQYSIPYHPRAMKNVVGGKDYKRAHRARLVLEAQLNGLSYNEFIYILRNEFEVAQTLDYLPREVIVHHKNGRPWDDRVENLEVLEKHEHDRLHSKEASLRWGNRIAEAKPVLYVNEGKVVDTYDIGMAEEPHNFVTHSGFVVHNSGKTSVTGGLAEHGQRLFIADFDDNLHPLFHFLSPKAQELVHFETLVDRVRLDPQGNEKVSPPFAFQRFVKLMRTWADSETGEDFGAPESWGPDSWLVIDTLTALGRASMYYTLQANNRWGKPKRRKEWGDAIARLTAVIDELRALPLNLIVNTHLQRLDPGDDKDDEDENDRERERQEGVPRPAKIPFHLLMQRYPVALGQKLPMQLGGMFNMIIQTKQVGTGKSARPVIRTRPDPDVAVKCPVPSSKLKVEYEADELFTLVQLVKGGASGSK